jgi:hypothetical protein
MLLIVDLKTVFSTEFVCVIIIHQRTKFHMCCYNDSLVITIKPEAKCRFRATAMLLFYILQKDYLNKCMFFDDLLPDSISGPYI